MTATTTINPITEEPDTVTATKRNRQKRHRAFWKDIKFKYKLTIINENTLEEVVGLHVSKLNGISWLVLAMVVLFIVASLIMVFTPLRNYLPGYMNSEIREQVVSNALRADSLQQVLAKQDLYIANIQDIFRGTVKADTIQSIDSLTTLRADTLMNITQRETDFRKQYEEQEMYNLTNIAARTDADGLIFYRPAQGIILRPFDTRQSHPGTDINAEPGGNILATLDGTVILSTYTAQSGYLIAIQHRQGFLSVYKHCGSLLKREGDVVTGGEPIALARGETAEEPEQTDRHLHFELWHQGKAVNPELYIVF